MFWWDWNSKRKFSVLGLMLAIAATPWLFLGWFPGEIGALVGGTAFLMIPQLVGWLLLIGLRTGRMPVAYGGSEDRASSPVAFWIVAAMYAALLALAIGFILTVIADVIKDGLY